MLDWLLLCVGGAGAGASGGGGGGGSGPAGTDANDVLNEIIRLGSNQVSSQSRVFSEQAKVEDNDEDEEDERKNTTHKTVC